jgi:DMSO/TMAO reductase YedYZ molybdopterin-dependent catalytic subunit
MFRWFQAMKSKLITLFIFMITLLLLLSLNTATPVSAATSSSLGIINLADTNFTFTQQELLLMPKTEVNANLYCFGSLVTAGNWVGIQLSYLLTLAQVTSNVSSIEFYASDGYSVSIPTELAMQPQVIVAYEKDNQSLSEGLRLILPGYNGGSWVSMITSISMSASTVDYPLGLNVGNITPPQPQMQKTNPQPTPRLQTTLTPSLTPENTASANDTSQKQSVSHPQFSEKGSRGNQVVFFSTIASAFVLVLLVIFGLIYMHKKDS